VGGSEGLVAEIAGAILDGTPVDWASVESSANPTERSFLEHLRVVAAVADIHRQPFVTTATSSVPRLDEPGSHGAMLEQWGQLRVLERIGRGAFGEVFRAWDSRLDREVALKLLPADASSGEAHGTSIIEEGRLLARVRHPNVVTIYGAERIEGRIGLWMEFVKGRTLQQVLDQGKTFTAAEALRIGIELCRAVSAVHAAGLVHRDIKTHNVTLGDDGRVVLMDFGTGHELSDGTSSALAGTPLYLAPELLSGSEPTVHSDIYSVGVLLYHLLTAAYPVSARSLRDLRLAHERHERTDVRSARPDLPSGVARVIERAIDPQPGRRYPNAEALRGDLARHTPRARVERLARASALMAVLILMVMIGWEVVGHVVGSSRTPSALLARVFGSSPLSVKDVVAEVAAETSSIAVLPFENVSGARAHEYFAGGITQEIFTALASVRSLRVISPTSAIRYRDSVMTPRDIAGELGVAHLLTGRVQREADRVQIWVQLIDARREAPLWTERYEPQLENIFAVHSDIAQQVAAVLQAELTPGERARLTRGRTSNPTAHDYLLRARELVLRFNLRDNDAGLALVRQALELDPDSPEAHAALVMPLAMRYWHVGDRSLLDSAIVAARRAIVLDPTLAGAYSGLGWALDHSGDPQAALQAHQQAVQLSPNLSDGLAVLYHWSFGQLDEAARWWAPALARAPTNTNTYWQAGKTYLCLGMLPRARKLLEKSVTFEPSFAWAQYHLTLVFLREGNRGQARAQIERMLAATREDSSALTFAGLAAFAMEDLAAARGYLERGVKEAPAYVRRHGTVALAWILQQSGEKQRTRELVKDVSRQFEQFWGGPPKRPEDLMDLARIRVLQGNREDALQLMETAVRRGWRFVYDRPNAQILGSLQGDPRYDALMAEVYADIERMRARVEREGW
jgi:TolB-like protein/Flp pilus assembly protein TadD/predicted Ser/Thr protein kinase